MSEERKSLILSSCEVCPFRSKEGKPRCSDNGNREIPCKEHTSIVGWYVFEGFPEWCSLPDTKF